MFADLVKKHLETLADFDYFEMSREERMKVWWDRFRVIMAGEEFRLLIENNSHQKM